MTIIDYAQIHRYSLSKANLKAKVVLTFTKIRILCREVTCVIFILLKKEGEIVEKKVLVFVGTRPEAIKMAPVYKELKLRKGFNPILVSSGQHKEMLAQALTSFDLAPDIDLKVMTSGQSLSGMSARLFEAIDGLLEKEEPDCILVQGDTTTVQVASLVAFYRRIPVGHVEAGLRSHNIYSPFPEELNRKITGLVATWHFAPTSLSKNNLLSEGIPEDKILVSGNTVIDSLKWMCAKLEKEPPKLPLEIEDAISQNRRIILVTAHRRESFGDGFEHICAAIEKLSAAFPEDRIVYPLHLNPNVRKVVFAHLNNHKGIILIDPLDYETFVYLVNKSYLVLTDSGGIQEEAPSLGKPVLVMRDVTERPEGVEAGVNLLVGTDASRIFSTANKFLVDLKEHARIVAIPSPFGDGTASKQIVNFLEKHIRS